MASPQSARANEAFADFVSQVKPTAARICHRYSIPPQDAEDLMQQALLAFIGVRHGIDDPEAWLAGTLRNHCLMYWRRRRRRLYRAVDSAILEQLAAPTPSRQEAIEWNRDLGRVIGRLPLRCRSILRLRYGLGCQPRETAERLGYRSSSIYKILNRCLDALTRGLTVEGLAPAAADKAGRTNGCQSAPSD